jgi:Tc toxin complex TcA C-terminal TcB-binding domain/Neuraminidase-like domain/Salmonella virulence plasmid 28.1kDa A protein/Putative peptidoglycan binding domain
MQLQGRNLSIEMRGADVALLQSELRQLGLSLGNDEERFFGPGTQQAVLIFQRQHLQSGLQITGVVDKPTARLINELQPPPQPISFVVQGQVRQPDGVPVVGVTVRAFHQTATSTIDLGQSITTPDGGYRITYQFQLPPGSQSGPNLMMQVLDAQGKLLANPPVVNNASPEQRIDIVVTLQEQPDTPFIVQGLVRLPDGTPSPNITVKAFDKDLRSEQELGTTTTNSDGYYRIPYTREQFSRAEKLTADLIVRAFYSDPTGIVPIFRLLATSDVLYNAPSIASIDLTIGGEYRGKSEYERYVAEVTPLLQDIPLANLREDEKENAEQGQFQDISFLTNETGINPEHLAFLVLAARLEQQTRSDTASFNLEAAIFYGCFRQNLPTDLPSLLSQSPAILRRALEIATAENIIPYRLKEQLEQILNRLQELIVERAFQPPASDKSSLADLLRTVIPSETLQRSFLTRYVQHQGDIEDFWSAVRSDEALSSSVDTLQFTLQLSALTQNHLPLVQHLQRGRQAGLRPLAAFNEADWVNMLNIPVGDRPIGTPPDIPGNTSDEKNQNYARILTRILEDAFPTAALAGKIAANITAPARNDFIQFFRNVHVYQDDSDFNLGTTYLPKYLADNADRVFEGVSDRQQLTDQLMGTQRLFRLTPRYQEIQPLQASGLHSAQGIVRIGQTAFVQRFSPQIGEDQAKAIYARAHQVTATMLVMLSDYSSNLANPAAIQNQTVAKTPSPSISSLNSNPTNSANLATAAAVDTPDWRALFGAIDLCACEHCRSVYSPAAYLVDILQFLKNRKLIDHIDRDTTGKIINIVYKTKILPDGSSVEKTAKDVLFKRRPDIGDIQLTCENTNTPVVYVDLVNEVLENAVSPLTATPASDRQTRITTEELRANPEYTNSDAYDQLRTAIYPWTLPFDLWSEAAHVYLEHLGVHRYELMETFQKPEQTANSGNPAIPASPSALEIATEYLGLTTVERQIITGTHSKQQQPWEFWGYADETSWLGNDGVKKVRVFLDRSGLSYDELTSLINTRFINPNPQNKAIDIQPGTTCDVDQMNFISISKDVLSKIHRFVCLWRKLGWKMRELDRAIAAFQPADLNDTFLIQLSHIQRLKVSLKLSLTKVLSLWTDLDTDGDDALYNKLFLNKAIINPVDTAFDLIHPNPSNPKISAYKATILAVLQLREADLEILKNATGLTDDLNLTNLSMLHRYTVLAKALRLSIIDFLSLKILTGIDLFDPVHAENTLKFIEKAGKIRASGFRIAELNYLLRHDFQSSSGIAPSEESIALILDEIRKGLQQVAEENTLPDNASEPVSDLVRKKLTFLKWDEALIEQAIAILNGSVLYETPLDPLPKEIVFPTSVSSKVSYNSIAKMLQFAGVMTGTERTSLKSATAAAGADLTAYQNAVDQLFNKSRAETRTFLAQRMQAFELPTFSASLAPLPASATFSDDLKSRIFYDSTAKALRYIGAMTEGKKNQLLKLLSDTDPAYPAYEATINSLFDQAIVFSPLEPKNQFLVVSNDPQKDDFTRLFDSGMAIPDRLTSGLTKLLAYLRTTLSESLAKQKLSEILKLETSITNPLLTQWVNSAVDVTRRAIADFLDPAFAESRGKLVAASFKPQFDTFIRLQKIATLIAKFKITPQQFTWISQYAASAGWLEWNALPVEAGSPPASFTAWERMVDLVHLRDTLPLGDVLLADIFKLARDGATTEAELLQELSDRTNWNLEDFQFLTSPQGFAFTFPNAYQNEKALIRLQTCFQMIKRLGISAEKIHPWIKPDLLEADAHNIKQAVKAKYDNDQWLTVAKPLRDILREKQRAALVTYLVAHPDSAKNQIWKDVNELYAHFLIDVEMSPCQMTSRIKQACGSVQLFVQRCLMNLEAEVTANSEIDGAWTQWEKWRKYYRIWEANRKVFLYAENWVEPELRDNKTPFFKDLENELLQNDVTNDTAEDAFLHYLEKLDQVARLEIVGMYHQQEPAVQVDILHVFGRTSAIPHIYYYRKLIVDKADWTAWKKIDLDIQGDHLIPVVWNRRLHLFWPIYTEKANQNPDLSKKREQSIEHKQYYPPADSVYSKSLSDLRWTGEKWVRRVKQDGDPKEGFTVTDPVPFNNGSLAGWEYKGNGTWLEPGKEIDKPNAPEKYWEIQIAWSEYKNDKWSAKKISEEVLKSDRADEKSAYVFKADNTGNGLIVDCFYTKLIGDFFHSEIGRFSFEGCQGNALIRQFNESEIWIVPPERSITEKQVFSEYGVGSDDSLYLSAGRVPDNADFNTVIQRKVDIETLKKTPGRFQLLYPHQDDQFLSQRPFFYQDNIKTFFVIPENNIEVILWNISSRISPAIIDGIHEYYYKRILVRNPIDPAINPGELTASQPSPRRIEAPSTLARTPSSRITTTRVLTTSSTRMARFSSTAGRSTSLMRSALRPKDLIDSKYRPIKHYQFATFYHPYVCLFIRELNRYDINGLLKRDIQRNSKREYFAGEYQPVFNVVDTPYPLDDVSFSNSHAYAQYNWELFFHIPLIIGDRLSKNQHFAEAQKWFHYIFNPTDTSAAPKPSRYWQTRPFFEGTGKPIQDLLRILATPDNQLSVADQQEKQSLINQISQWQDNPFNPHLIARLRITAYQKTVVMKYIDNLIAWGDQLFRRDTIESINEATQLYILAAELLGKRPENIPPRVTPQTQTYNSLEPGLDALSNKLVQAENSLSLVFTTPAAPLSGEESLPDLSTLYFCIPQNDKLLGYWDTVGDRLFKIRHCLNIEGIERQLPLFEPPIDPALLVRAFAAGIDLSSILNDLNAPLPHYRFNVMVQKASELCSEVKSLGAALLSVLEKKDTEELTLLRSKHEIKLLEAVQYIKQQQVEEASATLEGLRKAKEVTNTRYQFYANIQFINDWETTAIALTGVSGGLQLIANIIDVAGGGTSLIPDITIGVSGIASPVSTITYGGAHASNSSQSWSRAFNTLASIANTVSSMSATMGGYQRRADEWDLQKRVAAKELEQMDKQIASAEIRVAIAEKELQNHILQIENAKEIDDFMRNKFTNQELYNWMVSQLSGTYFQSYQLAYDIAKRTERCYRFELGLTDSNFIQFGYWDSLKKGLLSGEKLQYDLRRLETAYLGQNRREFELTKHISLTLLDPLALVKLRETGRCFINLPEEIFDLDYPGHYFRRIKSVSITLPCIVGPYTTISCTLRLLKNSIRIKTGNGESGYPRNTDDTGLPTDDNRFIENNIPVKAIAASNAQNDSGVFELSFRDERYLPFEGAGAISQWSLELFNDNSADFGTALRQFDYGTITDAILHIKYTAREDAGPFKNGAVDHLRKYFSQNGATPSLRMFNLRQEFPSQWHHFLNPTNPADGNVFELEMISSLFPIRDTEKTLKINTIWLLARCTDPGSYGVVMTPPLPALPPGSNTMTLVPVNQYGGLHFSQKDNLGIKLMPTDPPVKWQIKMTRPGGSNLQEDPVKKVMEVEDLLIVLGYAWE